MNKILIIGEALIDMICTDTGLHLSNGNNFLKKAGGAPANVAVAIKRLGGNVDIVAKVGNDPFGQHIIDLLETFGLNTNYIFKDDKYFTTLAFVSLLENGERDFFFNRGADGNLNENDLALLNINDYNIVHFGSATAFLPGQLKTAYHKLFQKSIENKSYISFDPNYRQLLFQHDQPSFITQSWQFMEKANFIKLSDEEALLITQTNSLDEAVKVLQAKTNAIITITIGKKGTLLIAYNQIEIIPSIDIKAIDSTGAGDAFVGAILFQINHLDFNEIQSLDFMSWKKMVANANLAGAKTCEYYGAMEALKHLSANLFKI